MSMQEVHTGNSSKAGKKVTANLFKSLILYSNNAAKEP